MRLLAYHLLLERYDEARRAVTYVRWKDADAYAPSLYAGRGNGNHKKDEAAEPVVVAPKPAAPAIVLAPDDDPFVS